MVDDDTGIAVKISTVKISLSFLMGSLSLSFSKSNIEHLLKLNIELVTDSSVVNEANIALIIAELPVWWGGYIIKKNEQ